MHKKEGVESKVGVDGEECEVCQEDWGSPLKARSPSGNWVVLSG